jgi:hypothetical protein
MATRYEAKRPGNARSKASVRSGADDVWARERRIPRRRLGVDRESTSKVRVAPGLSFHVVALLGGRDAIRREMHPAGEVSERHPRRGAGISGVPLEARLG